MHSIRHAQSALLILVIRELLHICLLAKMGTSRTLSGQLGAPPLASLATDSGPSWRKTWVLHGIY